MTDRTLLAALSKFRGHAELPVSQFTKAQQFVLDRFAGQTRALLRKAQGRGGVYQVLQQEILAAHLNALSPGGSADLGGLPARARHIANARNSKSAAHRHDKYNLLFKACSAQVSWKETQAATLLPLSDHTRDFGVAALSITPSDHWQTDQDLWLVENQALFDRTDWLPTATKGSIAYYGGQLNGVLLAWMATRERAPRVILFPDYDGVGFANYTRLHQLLGERCTFWLMPDWREKLAVYGNRQLWQDTRAELERVQPQLPSSLNELLEQMAIQGLALEQESVWLD
ncbi:DUF7281 domain-containing protein [Crenobacter intestini]|uniref:DUF7281 domain-containing protein n=1 Tax=Crenobacter intestini TaxID=2563443 RepID=A0A4T0UP27_9NEIS|nr:hypothetical protein [Crenobacter intestini]TIC80286.1 hypothetical protein E5K04_12315 [Crenobacter intestini]